MTKYLSILLIFIASCVPFDQTPYIHYFKVGMSREALLNECARRPDCDIVDSQGMEVITYYQFVTAYFKDGRLSYWYGQR